jgi:hypothetical protein
VPFNAASLLLWHNTELILYHMAEAVGLPLRDVALLNKGGAYVDKTMFPGRVVPTRWFNPVRRVFVRENGIIKEQPCEDRPEDFVKSFVKHYASYYGKAL